MNKKINLIPLFLIFTFSLLAQEERFSPELLWKLGRVSIEDVSPDGNWILYGITYYDVDENKGNRDLYIMNEQGDEARKITAFEGTEHNARFRPDGKKIGFLFKGNLWEMNPDGSDKRKVSDISMNGFAYSPDLSNLLFIDEVDYSVENPLSDGLPMANARIIDDLMYRHWNDWEDYKHSNIFLVEYNDGNITGKKKNIQKEPFDTPLQPFGGMEQISWSPDGSQIAYTCKKLNGTAYATSTNSDIFIYDIESEITSNVSANMPGYDKNPKWSPDGTFLAWNSMEEAGFEADKNRIILHDINSGKRQELTEDLDQSFGLIHWSADSDKIYSITGVEATYQIAEITVENGQLRLITSGLHNYYDIRTSANGLIGSKASMLVPNELYFINLQNGQENRLSNINTDILSDVENASIERKWIKTHDDKDMLVLYIYPPGFDASKKYPTLLYCQGGPQSAVSQFFSYRWNFQLMAANDYIIIAPNRRGLPTFGQEWNDQISGDWGGKAMQDYITAIDDAAKLDYVDENRLGAIGASYGGYSVYWLAGNHEKRFKTFISHCGVFNLDSWYGSTEELFFATKDLGGAYWNEEHKEAYNRFSPHNYVDNWDTPILVIHGGKDFRIPETEGMQAFTAAKLKGLKSRFLHFPEEGHWVLSPQNGLLWHRTFFDWLETTLKK